MSATVIRVNPEIPGAVAPTPSGKPAAQKDQAAANTNAPANGAEQRPDWVPEKFWKDGKVDTEGLAKSYSELEKKSSTPPAKPAEGEATPADKPGDKPADVPVGEKALDPFVQEFSEKGKLSDESYEALGKLGHDRKTVDRYIRGVQAEQAESEGKVFEAVGGKDEYAKVTEWAGKNLQPGEINAFNSMLETGTPEQIALAAAGLKTRYEAANGKPANLVRGSSNGGGGVAPFRSSHEVTTAMNDPRYKQGDEAYHAEVQARLAVSDVL